MNAIISSKEINNYDIAGGKAEGLNFLSKNKFNVPAFFVLNYETIDALIQNTVSTDESVNQWKNKYNINSKNLWAVRSSANLEDGESSSFAGLFKTEINVAIDDIAKAIESVISSYTNFTNLNYTSKNLKFAIVIQQMIQSEYSGVIFSHNPNNLSDNTTYLNIIPGLGDNLVSGKEESLTIKFKNGKFTYLNHIKEYSGQVYNESLQDIKLSADELKNNIAPFQKELIQGAKKIYALKKHPVDIEFTIANNTIYWLQVRPITSKPLLPTSVIWDNANISENYPGITLPLSTSFVKYTYSNAYSGMASFLGMTKVKLNNNSELLENMVGSIYGGLYYNITAWQQLLYQLPFGKKTSKLVTDNWGMEKAEFSKPSTKVLWFGYLRLVVNIFTSFLLFNKHKQKFEATFKNIFLEFEHKDFLAFSNNELNSDFHKIDKDLGAKWTVPVLNGFFALLLFSFLKKVFRKSRLHKLYPNFINDVLYAQGDVVSVKIVKDFQQIINTILNNEALKDLFATETENTILAKISDRHTEFKSLMDDYIESYGERCGEGELKIETINYKEDPIRFITMLKMNAVGSASNTDTKNNIKYRSVIKEKYKYRPLKRAMLLYLIKATLLRIRDRENYRFYRTKAFHIIRRIFRAMDNNLLHNNKIENKGDSHYLNFNELTNSSMVSEYKTLISKRKKEHTQHLNKTRANRYTQNGDNFTPTETNITTNIKDVVKGIGCSSGTLTKEVVIITSAKIDTIDITDKILVASYFEPGWINLFSKASGVISEKGSLLCHTAILCREMGIPAIVGAKGIISAVKNDTRVQMNGSTGEIKII